MGECSVITPTSVRIEFRANTRSFFVLPLLSSGHVDLVVRQSFLTSQDELASFIIVSFIILYNALIGGCCDVSASLMLICGPEPSRV